MLAEGKIIELSSLDWNSVAGWLAVSTILIVALVVPGYALLLYIPALAERWGGFVERASAALGLSVLLTPVFFLAMRLLNLPIGGPLLIALLLAALLAIALKVRCIPHLRSSSTLSLTATLEPAAAELMAAASKQNPESIAYGLPASLALFAIFLVGLTVRVHQAWGEAAALGSDGYHHTLISQLIIDQQGIPHNYLPYAPLTSFTYHYGFHALVAISYWLGGWALFGAGTLTTARLTLMVGQILSALAPFAVYLLAVSWLGRRSVGVVAALVTLLSIFPTYYLDWGRDTQMAGLLGLPVLMIVTVMLLDADPHPNPLLTRGGTIWATIRRYLAGGRVQGLILLTGAGAAGLLLDHYRIIIVYAYFAGIYWIVRVIGLLAQRRTRWVDHASEEVEGAGQPQNLHSTSSILHSIFGITARAAAAGLVALLVASPWLLNLLGNFSFTLQTGSKIPPVSFFSTSLSSIIDRWWWNAPLWSVSGSSGLLALLAQFTSPLMILSVIGWVFGILYRNRYVISLGLLTVALLALSSPYFVNVPLLAGRVDYQTVASLLWLPQGVLIGYMAATLMREGGRRFAFTKQRRSVVVGAALAVVIALAAAWPLWDAREADPIESYLMPADLAALAWVHQNTNENSLFLTNTFTWSWAANSRTGSDGGLWLPLIAGGGRKATAPPLPYNNEKATSADYRNAVIATSRAANQVDQQQAVDYLRSIGVKYAYIGARSTSAAIAPPNQSSNPDLATARDKNLIISGNLDVAQFRRAPQWWQQIYARNGVYIFELK